MLSNIDNELKKALQEIGTIQPWWDEDVSAFVFEHSAYPVRYAGDTEQEVIENYPQYLREFIAERLAGNLAPEVERATSGRGGRRPGAGRPLGTRKEATERIRLPLPIVQWLRDDPDNVDKIRRLMG
ncbi:MAG TPA: hypothetical protein V6C52_00460 [Coleofasciculaceae cyanobacterium]|jgi:hypothetical protein